MANITVPGACHDEDDIRHGHHVRELVRDLGSMLLRHISGRAGKLEREAAELRQQAAAHEAACRAAGIEFVDLDERPDVADLFTGHTTGLAPSVGGSGSP